MKEKVVSRGKIGIGLFVVLCLLTWTFTLIGRTGSSHAQVGTTNLIASHDSSSRQYNRNCTSCHSSILTEKSLDPSIRNVHVTMVPLVPGENNNTRCRWCHRTVDLSQGTQRVEKSKGNLRKGVNATLCTLCHSPSGPGLQFYQSGISPVQPDGPALYELVCAACHGSLPNSQVRGESASEIQKKINENEGGMGPLEVLTPEEIRAIANALR